MKKGDLIGVEGHLQTRSYEKDDKRVYVTEVVVDNIDFLQSKIKFLKDEENLLEESKKGLSDDLFSEFGSSIEINDDGVAF